MASKWPFTQGHSMAIRWPVNGQSVTVCPRPCKGHAAPIQVPIAFPRNGQSTASQRVLNGHSMAAMLVSMATFPWPFN
eukprot:497642-Lingulodinium_polyedra.AAC.1